MAEEPDFEYIPEVKQTPTTTIGGEVVDVLTAKESGAEDPSGSIAVVFKDPTVEKGTLWVNANKPEGFDSVGEYNDALRIALSDERPDYLRGREVTDEVADELLGKLDEYDADAEYDSERVRGTDYKLADESDKDFELNTVPVDGEDRTVGIELDGNSFNSSRVEEMPDKLMVWYGGMSGQILSRGLDFNGMPFARYTEDGYLMKGLYQAPVGWRGEADVEQYDTTNTKSSLKSDRVFPRMARPVALREDLPNPLYVTIGRFNGGRMYEASMGGAVDDNGEVTDESTLEMQYEGDDPEAFIREVFDVDDVMEVYDLYHSGPNWMDEPESVERSGDTDNSGGSFDMGDGDDSDSGGLTDGEEQFATMVAEQALAGSDVPIDDATFDVDGETVPLGGLVEHNAAEFDTDDPDVDGIAERVEELR
jgi:hypothetical protein